MSSTTSYILSGKPTAKSLQDANVSHLGHADLRALLSRFLVLLQDPRGFAPIIANCWLLIQSTWSGRELGPDLVYPLLGIKKRQSERLARLILEHSRDQQSYELRATKEFPRGIDPPCVAVIDLNQVHPNVIRAEYCTGADIHGVAALAVLFEIIVIFVLLVFYIPNLGFPLAWRVLFLGIICLQAICTFTLSYGDGILILAQRSKTSGSGCAVLLDEDFTLVLNGNQAVVEAIAQSGFNLSVPRPFLSLQDSPHHILDALCDGVYIAIWMLCYMLFRPSTVWTIWMLFMSLVAATLLSLRPIPITFVCRVLFPYYTIGRYLDTQTTATIYSHDLNFLWLAGPLSLYTCFLSFFSAKHKTRNYPIRSAKFLDAIGRPYVRKWQFNTPAAAATFQCLVVCHGINRPIGNIDVLAFLDMLVLDETELWRVWKRRVSDRIMHEEVISFTPTIPMFRDERQQELVNLLDEAQLGYEKYVELYAQGTSPDLRTVEDVPLTFLGRLWAPIQYLLSSASIIERSPIYDTYVERSFRKD